MQIVTLINDANSYLFIAISIYQDKLKPKFGVTWVYLGIFLILLLVCILINKKKFRSESINLGRLQPMTDL